MKGATSTAAERKVGLSLADVHGSVAVPVRGPAWRRWLAVAGPALMVSVGYMDPGNWATDIAGGSRYEYKLLWVLLMSNLMAVLLQSLAARLGIVRRRDLAQASREEYPPLVSYALYGLAEIAVAATDLAEVVGSAIALELLFGLPLFIGVPLTTLDVLLLLLLTHFGIRKLEAVILSLVGTIGIAFLIEIVLARPGWGDLSLGFVPSLPDAGALYVAIGILGATVMPHNLYLHSALVQTRRFGASIQETRRSLRLNTLDSAVSLNLAFLVNAAILVMAAAVFFRTGHHQITEIQDAYRMLEPILGAAVAPLAFAIALLASGQSSTVTGTLAGQIVMEGYLNLRIRPWLRRMLTRTVAVVPALLTLTYFGEGSTGNLLVLSQVILSLQLPFAVIPLVHIVSDRKKMGEFAIGGWIRAAAWVVVVVIVGLNVGLVVQVLEEWISQASGNIWLIRLIVLPLALALATLLIWVSVQPWIHDLRGRRAPVRPVGIHPETTPETIALQVPPTVGRVAIALDFSGHEELLLREALRFVGSHQPRLVLLHVVESAPARAFGHYVADGEARSDARKLEAYAQVLRDLRFEVETGLGAGDPVSELARMVGVYGADLVILGGHGHRGISDVIHGTTAEALRHRIRTSVLVIPLDQ
jgi:manganese transport protein